MCWEDGVVGLGVGVGRVPSRAEAQTFRCVGERPAPIRAFASSSAGPRPVQTASTQGRAGSRRVQCPDRPSRSLADPRSVWGRLPLGCVCVGEGEECMRASTTLAAVVGGREGATFPSPNPVAACLLCSVAFVSSLGSEGSECPTRCLRLSSQQQEWAQRSKNTVK